LVLLDFLSLRVGYYYLIHIYFLSSLNDFLSQDSFETTETCFWAISFHIWSV
jgi:hypothetical protein